MYYIILSTKVNPLLRAKKYKKDGMENSEIARQFNEIADLLEIKGANPFRIRSYRNAALVIEGYPISFKRLLEKGPEALKGIPGIGESIREKIIEMLETGHCTFHDNLVRELPPGILDILRLSGVGPKKTAEFYKFLGIGSVEELRRAALDGKLRELPGMGPKSEEKILRAIESFQKMDGRRNLAQAWSEAAAMEDFIARVRGVQKVAVAGSLRRWKESIGDMDILAACTNPLSLMKAFTSHPDAAEVLMHGSTKSTIVLKSGFQVDLRVVEKKAFGAALQYFTGSKAHNITMREKARKQGLKINEYGVFDKRGRVLACATEEDVYKAVGLPLMIPEIRENTGEFEAAEKGGLPVVLGFEHIKGDLHAHTKESDGADTLEDMAAAAMELGYEYLAITDHSRALGVANGLDAHRVTRQMEEIDAFNRKMKKAGKDFRLLKGAEVDILADGSLDHGAEILARMDCVVGSIHSGFSMKEARMTERIIKALSTGLVDILAHPTGRLIAVRPPYDVNMDALMEAAAEYNVCLELNSCPERLDLKDSHLRLAKERGIMVALSTDAHSTLQLQNMIFGIHMARRGWIEPRNILNAMDLRALTNFLSARKG